MPEFAVLGSGGWGTALSVMLNRLGHTVYLWSPFAEEIERIHTTRENAALLPGIRLEESIRLTSDIRCVENAGYIIIASPSFAVKETARLIKPLVHEDQILINVSKGLEPLTHRRLSVVIKDELPISKVVVLSGPSHAEEVARGIPTSLVAASENLGAVDAVQTLMMSHTLRIYANSDMVGVELGGALKNIIALAAGVCEGLGLGDNTRAALITRGIVEITSLGVVLGAKRETFAGLSGIGDLIVTCMSVHSRNRQAGILVGKGMNIRQAMAEIGKTVEGYHATKIAYELAETYGVEMPILEQCYQVLYNDKNPEEAIIDLMKRPRRHEMELF